MSIEQEMAQLERELAEQEAADESLRRKTERLRRYKQMRDMRDGGQRKLEALQPKAEAHARRVTALNKLAEQIASLENETHVNYSTLGGTVSGLLRDHLVRLVSAGIAVETGKLDGTLKLLVAAREDVQRFEQEMALLA
jgi:hypothetical protein